MGENVFVKQQTEQTHICFTKTTEVPPLVLSIVGETYQAIRNNLFVNLIKYE